MLSRSLLPLGMVAMHAGATLARPVGADVLDLVDTFIGSGGEGYGCAGLFPGPQLPFSTVRLSPDTSPADRVALPFCHTGGYAASNTMLDAFSHLRMVGAGVSDLGNVGVLPLAGPFRDSCAEPLPCRSELVKETERARPGSYEVTLRDGTYAELTTTQWVGVHRYSFDASSSTGTVIVDLGHGVTRGQVKASNFVYNASVGTADAYLHNTGGYSGRFGGFDLFVRVEIAGGVRPSRVSAFDRASPGSFSTGVSRFNGTEVALVLEFDAASAGAGPPQVELHVALSFISAAQAVRNLATDLAPLGGSGGGSGGARTVFDAARTAAETAWRGVLSRVTVNDPSPSRERLVALHTAVYHAHLAPTVLSEAGGSYVGVDKQVHALPQGQGAYYTDMSIWDIHRTQSPLLVLLAPSVQRDVLRSLVLMLEQAGDLPKWPFVVGYTGGMIGTHANAMIADAMVKGIDGVDYGKAYEGMRAQATEPRKTGRDNPLGYIKYGYVPFSGSDSKSTPQTLAYAYDDAMVAAVAAKLGKADDAALFANRSRNYRNVWDPRERFFCPRTAAGDFKCPLVKDNPFSNDYVEGDAHHWRWAVRQDPDGLIELFGGAERFIEDLTAFFDNAARLCESNVLPCPWWWPGNEEDLIAPALFSFAGRRDLAATWFHDTLKRKYTVSSDGIPGNDDYGTMSSWAIFATLGFYPQVAPGNYIVHAPVFENVTLTPENGAPIHITRSGNPTANLTVAINGVVVPGPTFTHADIVNGATITFVQQ